MSQVEAEELSQSGVAMGSAGSEAQSAQTEKKFLSLRQAAIQVLKLAPAEGLTPKEIYDAAIKSGLVDSERKGKTPWATLAAAFYTDINKSKVGGATFRLASKGHFALTETVLSGKITPRPAATTKPKTKTGKKSKSENPAAALKGKFPAPTTDVRGRPLSPNTHAHCKVICGVKQKTKNGTVICRVPWTGKRHDGEHNFQAFRNTKGNEKNSKKTA